MAGGILPGSPVTDVESWNGTTWTEVNDINTSKIMARVLEFNTAG
jgi:hypothetical protein